jgi:predicted nucleotidyltransferase
MVKATKENKEGKGERETWLNPKEKLLKYLIENKEPHSILEASGAIVVDYKNTYNTIKNFSPDILSKNKLGNTTLIEIKLSPNPEVLSIEHKRAGMFLSENKKLELIKKDAELVGYPFMILLIFGSYVKKNKTEKSDIDLCIISDNKIKTEELISKLRLLPLNLEIHDFNVKEFESMLELKKENIAKEIIKNNVILYGIENYYNLIAKSRKPWV